jgi:hypothetical protein
MIVCIEANCGLWIIQLHLIKQLIILLYTVRVPYLRLRRQHSAVCTSSLDEAEERDEPSSLPGGAVEVGVREVLLDLGQEVPARRAVSNMVTGRATFVFSRVELPNDESFAVLRMPDDGARVSFSREDFGILEARVVDTELDRHDTDIGESKGHQAGVASDGQVGSVSVFTDDKAALAFAIVLCGVGEVLFRGATHDPKLSRPRKLERGHITPRIENRHKIFRRIFRS